MLVVLVEDNQKAVPCSSSEECEWVVELEVVVLEPLQKLHEEL